MLWSPQYWSERHQIVVQFLFYIDNESPETQEPKGSEYQSIILDTGV